MEPLVSVVIPSFNNADVLGQALDSALGQTYPRLEVIVIDDGSTDDTKRAVQPYRERIQYVRQENGGLASARNAGLARARGDLVAWLDSDDVWEPEKVALQVAVLQERPECALIASDFSAFDDAGFFERSHARRYYGALERSPGGLAGLFPHRAEFATPGRPHLRSGLPERVDVYWGDLRRRLAWGNVLHPPTVMFRRDAAARAGLLEPAFRRDADWEYLIRVAAHGAVAFVDHPLMRYRLSPGQMSSDRHRVDIALSRQLVLDALAARDRSLREDPAFRRRLGSSHLAVANALADVRRIQGARHLVRSLAYGHVNGMTWRTAAKLLLPGPLARALRRRGPLPPGAA